MKATHWIIAAALLPGSSFCQYSGLAVTRDGSRVYFASTLRQRGTDQFLHSKIFLLDDAGVTLAAQRERIGVSLTNPYILTAPQISGDGAVVAYANTLTCQGGSSCFLRERTGGTVTFAGGRPDFSFGGVFRLSRNGRYLARCSSSGVMAATASLEDLAGGTSTDLLEDLGRFTPLAVSSRGAVLLTVPSTGVVLFQDKKKHILARDETYAADIDDAGTTVVFQNTRAQLVVVDVAGGRQWALGATDRANIRPSLSDDGQYVLYLSRIGAADQILFSRIDGSEWRQLTALEEGISEARLSGDGKIAYAIAGNGAILRIDTGSGVVRTLVGRTPRIDGIIGGAAPGSANILYGAHLAPETATAASPLPEQLRGVTVRIGEQPALVQMCLRKGSCIRFPGRRLSRNRYDMWTPLSSSRAAIPISTLLSPYRLALSMPPAPAASFKPSTPPTPPPLLPIILLIREKWSIFTPPDWVPWNRPCPAASPHPPVNSRNSSFPGNFCSMWLASRNAPPKSYSRGWPRRSSASIRSTSSSRTLCQEKASG